MAIEPLFGKLQSVILALIILAIAAIIIFSAVNAVNIFGEKQIPYLISVGSPEAVCTGGVMHVTLSNVSIEMTLVDTKIMPVLEYKGFVGYSESNLISIERGKGSANLAFDLTAMPSELPVWTTILFWTWSPGGCLNRTITTEPTYAALVRECAEDFMTTKSVAITDVSGCR